MALAQKVAGWFLPENPYLDAQSPCVSYGSLWIGLQKKIYKKAWRIPKIPIDPTVSTPQKVLEGIYTYGMWDLLKGIGVSQ